MQSGGIVCMMVICAMLIAGCIQLPGIHMLSNGPDPIVGQWIDGEPPSSDLHIIFYENQTFRSINFFINRETETDYGNWTKIEPGHYAAQSVTGKITDWIYDSFDDAVYQRGLPLRRYYRCRV